MDRSVRSWLASFIKIRDEIDDINSRLENNRDSIIKYESLLPVSEVAELIDQVNEVNKEIESLLKNPRIQLNNDQRLLLNNLNVNIDTGLNDFAIKNLVDRINHNPINSLSTSSDKESDYLSDYLYGMVTGMLEIIYSRIINVLSILRDIIINGISQLELLIGE